ncbi:Protease KEX1 [Psilocybe cubensis]|uniref:P/Homo B domain-containing protein n=2 Tax=Psilocybe cubensis TaxID=181762 RepID=A0A8H7XS12_PSICU|nr:Protease KEX1 [Psilocybe cubensis]KAH9479764.1 Protease KEX1 [Psilocybe cubensis]
MRFLWVCLASTALSTTTSVLAKPAKRHYDTHRYYALEHKFDERLGASLEEVASALGVEVVEQAGELKDVWLVRVPKTENNTFDRKALDFREDEDEDVLDPVISAFQDLKQRASSPLTSRSEDVLHAKRVVSSVNYLELQTPKELVKRAPPPIRPPTRPTAQGAAEHFGLHDPLFTAQWHLVNDDYPEHMMNVTPVWDMGLTGKGVLTSFLDDGLDFESDDLRDAFDAEHSYDFNAHVDLPRPTGARDHHGTRCAGQVAARRNNACGVGIAYDAKAAGVRILGGKISTVDEAAALNYGYKDVSLYSCSWGPRDNGQTMDGPNYLIRKAVVNGINNGRYGKGSIYVFASGNGGRHQDQCNFDGYTNSIYSVTVSSIDWKGLHPDYSEACAANMIVAYSSGSKNHIVTTDRDNECAMTHGGTSAAAPNAVGVFALALQARPDLTWRDIQHLCVETARKVNPNDPDWEKTASGRLYSYKYGYGAIDAYAYVTAAKSWQLVKPQAWLFTDTVIVNNGRMHSLPHRNYRYEGGEPIGPDGVEQKMMITKEMMLKNNLESLEHVDVRVWISHTRRGDVEVEIESPNGIRSILASTREEDEDDTGFPGWRFMSVKHWGENPVGEWTLRVFDQNDPEQHGKFLGWNMVLWGSAIDPTKATKLVEPVIDNALPPEDTPPRPEPNDPDLISSTQHAKPTDLLPEDHGHATGENTKAAFPSPSNKPKPPSKPQQDDNTAGDDEPSKAWYDHMSSLMSAQKWFFAALGAVVVFGLAALAYFYKRRADRLRLAEYRSLAADDISMDAIDGQSRSRVIAGSGGPRTTRALYDSFGEPSSSDNLVDRERRDDTNVNPPSARGLGFHSGFLDDDEPSAGLTPKYRDEPESRQPSARRPSFGVEDDQRRPSGEMLTPREEDDNDHDGYVRP